MQLRVRKKALRNAFVVAMIVIAAAAYWQFQQGSGKEAAWKVSSSGFLSYSGRLPEGYTVVATNATANYTLYAIRFDSRDAVIAGFLLLPHGERLPGIVLLPGAGVTKEAELHLAGMLASHSYAVLTIDQRGSGESGGMVRSLQDDFAAFLQGNEPSSHKFVYDALRAVAVLKGMRAVDAKRVALAGESFGGRNAFIAAAIEPSVSGLLGISTAGFSSTQQQPGAQRFLNSINPNYYAPVLAQRTFMIHSRNDSVVPLADAQQTFALLHEPKRLGVAEGCGHGYCDAMQDAVLEAAAFVTGQ